MNEADKKKQLFLSQKQTLDTFLSTGAISREQYEKSLGDLVRLMGMEDEAGYKKAYFACGCFWCITPVFMAYGALRVVCGYSGGDEVDPVYEDVKAQRTGHRETVCVIYDPNKLTYDRLMEIFIANVDPYDGEGQFIDKGHSYTLAVYYTDEAERACAAEAVEGLKTESGADVHIAIERFKSFYPAEDYHQDYYLKNTEAFEKEMRESGRRSSQE